MDSRHLGGSIGYRAWHLSFLFLALLTGLNESRKIGFIGLGAMGKFMAGHLQTQACTGNSPLLVWNRTPSVAADHACKYGTEHAQDLSDFENCSILFLSLPTSQQVKEVLAKCSLSKGTIVVGK